MVHVSSILTSQTKLIFEQDHDYYLYPRCFEHRKYTSAICERDPSHIERNEQHIGRDIFGRYHFWNLPVEQLTLF